MAETVTWDGLRELAEFRAEKGCAISLYVDLDPSVVPTAGDADTRFNSLLSEAERSSGANDGLTHDQRVGLKSDFERIRAYFESEFDRDGAHGLVLFSAGLDNVWRPRALTEPVPDRVRVGRDFHLAPLVPLVGRGEGALVAVVGRERGELYRLHSGRLEEIVDKTEEVPGKHDQGGWSQARFQRHIEKLVGEHLRDVADSLADRVRGMTLPKVIIVSTEETRAEFEEVLAKEAQGCGRRLDERGGACASAGVARADEPDPRSGASQGRGRARRALPRAGGPWRPRCVGLGRDPGGRLRRARRGPSLPGRRRARGGSVPRLWTPGRLRRALSARRHPDGGPGRGPRPRRPAGARLRRHRPRSYSSPRSRTHRRHRRALALLGARFPERRRLPPGEAAEAVLRSREVNSRSLDRRLASLSTLQPTGRVSQHCPIGLRALSEASGNRDAVLRRAASRFAILGLPWLLSLARFSKST